jgi:spore maturation protein CgeB
MMRRTGRPVGVLPQAADPGRFAPGATGPHHELLFVANSRRVGRHLVRDLLPTEHELAVYGQRWDRHGLDPRYHAGAHVPYEDLPGYYASADIVLNDHWTDMRREGMLSNRLFDASAAGAFVISDEIEGLEETFDGGVVAYRDPADLRRLIDRFLDDPEARAEHAARARARVLAAHTFDHRASTLLAAIEPLVRERGLTVGPPA